MVLCCRKCSVKLGFILNYGLQKKCLYFVSITQELKKITFTEQKNLKADARAQYIHIYVHIHPID